MDQDDPEKRIADLERQLAEHKPVAEPHRDHGEALGQPHQVSHERAAEADRPIRWQLTPIPASRQSFKPHLALAIDVGTDAIWVVNLETNALIASAWLAQVIATPAQFTYVIPRMWVKPNHECTQPLLVVDVPGMQSLVIGTTAVKGFSPPRFRFSWRGVAYPGNSPNYYLRDSDWLTLVEKFGLAGHLEDHDPTAAGGSLTHEHVRDVTFAVAPSGKCGYDKEEVDAFLALVVGALKDPNAHRLTPEQVRNVAFSASPLGKRGYNQAEVDAFLDLIEKHTKSEQWMVAAPFQTGSAPPATGTPARHARSESRTRRIARDTGSVLGGIARFVIEAITDPFP